MDYGHYNCRDYYITPHTSPTSMISERNPLYRHESFDELEQRSRSPASQKPKFPLLKLPLELRQQVLGYLLPRTQEWSDSVFLSKRSRNPSGVKKGAACGTTFPSANSGMGGVSNVVWRRGNINIFCVCKQLHDECAELVYGWNDFILFIDYERIDFRYRYLRSSGATPAQNLPFLKTLAPKYMRLIKRVVINVDHVDSYTGMVKWGVGGKGLTRVIRCQVQRVVNALCASPQDAIDTEDDRRLGKIYIRVSNGNAIIEALKSDAVRQREGGVKINEDVEEMLEPFGDLRGVGYVRVGGAVTDEVARSLEDRMRSDWTEDEKIDRKVVDQGMLMTTANPIQQCVYGNDID